MSETGTTVVYSTANNTYDALSFINDNNMTNTDDVRLLCIILKRSSCVWRRRNATRMLMLKLKDRANLDFFLEYPGHTEVFSRFVFGA